MARCPVCGSDQIQPREPLARIVFMDGIRYTESRCYTCWTEFWAMEPEGLPRGEWEEDDSSYFRVYISQDRDEDERPVFVDANGDVTYIDDEYENHILAYGPRLCYPQHERDPRKQPIIVDEGQILLL